MLGGLSITHQQAATEQHQQSLAQNQQVISDLMRALQFCCLSPACWLLSSFKLLAAAQLCSRPPARCSTSVKVCSCCAVLSFHLYVVSHGAAVASTGRHATIVQLCIYHVAEATVLCSFVQGNRGDAVRRVWHLTGPPVVVKRR